MAESIITGILLDLKTLAIWILYFSLLVAVIYIVSYIIIRHKRNRELEDVQKSIVREGRINVSGLKLRYLFTSDNLENPVNEGKIVSFVYGSLDGKEYSIFAVRKTPLSQIRFLAVDKGRHTKLFRDVMLKDWNFILDKNRLFHIKNTIEVEREVPFDEARKAFDILGNMSPLVHKAILANYEHRMRLRERKLIKLPEDEMR